MSVKSRKMLLAGAFGSVSVAASRMLAIALETSPFVTVYNVSGDVLTKIANPATLPTGNGYGVAFN